MSAETKIYSVSEVTTLIKSILEMNIPPVWVEGEISSWTKAASGHAYFSLKDSNAQLPCVIWKQNAASLLFKPEEGMNVRVNGGISVYEKSGKYQLIASQVQPAGVGDLYQQFEKLKTRLSAEGLFDEDKKTALPQIPFIIGVVTSPDGAVISDIINVLNRRAPYVTVKLEPTRVQGVGSAEEIAAALKKMDSEGEVDLIIIGRGGGSIEDLWSFNEEVVARAIFDCNTPVISSVGHEIDYTIADFVADLRAPTPSAAAELAAPKMDDLLYAIGEYSKTVYELISDYIREYEGQIDEYERNFSWERYNSMIEEEKKKISDHLNMIFMQQEHNLNLLNLRVESLSNNLDALNPDAVLARGYSVVSSVASGKVISAFNQVEKGEEINIKLHVGNLIGNVKEVSNGVR